VKRKAPALLQCDLAISFAPRFSVLNLRNPQLIADHRLLLALRPQSLQSLTLEDPPSSILGLQSPPTAGRQSGPPPAMIAYPGLSRRPVHMTAAEDMQMEMIYRLPSVLPCVHDGPISRLGNPFPLSNLRRESQ
jgi:hypothetical protein